MKGNNNETNKDVDHEECDDNKVDKVEKEHMGTVILLGSNVCLIWVNGNIQDPENNEKFNLTSS